MAENLSAAEKLIRNSAARANSPEQQAADEAFRKSANREYNASHADLFSGLGHIINNDWDADPQLPSTGSSVTGSVTNVIPSTSKAVGGVLSAGSTAVGGAVSSVETMASNGISVITTPIADATASLTKLANSAMGGISSFIGKAGSAAATEVDDVLGDLFGNSKDNTSLKTTTPDNVKAATVSGPVANGLYKINNQYAQATPVDLNNPLPQLTATTADTKTLATRLGKSITDAESSLLSAGRNFTHSSLVTGIMGSARSLGTSYTQLMDLAHQGTSLYHTVVNLPSTLETAGKAVYDEAVSNLAQEITGTVNGLNGFWNSSYTATTMSDGTSLDAAGLNPNVPSPMLTALYNSVNSKGCTYATVPGLYDYAAQESLKDADISLAYAFSLKGLLKNITSCSNYNRTVQGTGASLFRQDFGNNPGTASVLGEALDPSTVTLPQEQAKAAVTNASVADSDAGAIKSVFDRFGIDGTDLYTSDSSFAKKSAASGIKVFSIKTLNKSSKVMTATITGNTSLKSGVPRSGLVAV